MRHRARQDAMPFGSPEAVAACYAAPARNKPAWCVIDGEVIVCGENGLAVFELIRGHRTAPDAVVAPSSWSNWTAKTSIRRRPRRTTKRTGTNRRPSLVAIRSEDGKRVPRMMRWGLLPHWAKDEEALLLDVQRASRGVQNQARIQGRVETRSALPRRYKRFLRVEKARSQVKGKTAIRDRCPRRPHDNGRPLIEMDGPEIGQRDLQLCDHNLRTEHGDGAAARSHADHPGGKGLAEVARGESGKRRGITGLAGEGGIRELSTTIRRLQHVALSRLTPQYSPSPTR